MSAAAVALSRNTAVFRRRMGWSQDDLAEKAEVPRKTVYNTEKFGNAETRTVEKYADVFGVSLSTMFETDPETAEAAFLAAQVTRLSDTARETFHRVLASRAADDKIRPSRDRKGR